MKFTMTSGCIIRKNIIQLVLLEKKMFVILKEFPEKLLYFQVKSNKLNLNIVGMNQ